MQDSLDQIGRACLVKKLKDEYCVTNNIQVIRLRDEYKAENRTYLEVLYEWLSRPEAYSEQIVSFDTSYVNLTVSMIENLMVVGPAEVMAAKAA